MSRAAARWRLWVAQELDVAAKHPDEDAPGGRGFRRADHAGDQGLFTDLGFEIANLGVQIFGGHGYIREHGMEQFVRDARIPRSTKAPTASRRSTSWGARCRRTPGAVCAACSIRSPLHRGPQGQRRPGRFRRPAGKSLWAPATGDVAGGARRHGAARRGGRGGERLSEDCSG